MTQAITSISVDVLRVHPRNAEFFDDISGDEYDRFKKSIQDDGLLSPLIVAPDMTVISGHQRLKACKELGFKSIPVIIKDDLEDEDEKLRKLIAANFGRLKNDPVKQGKLLKEYERLRGIRQGSKNARGTIVGDKLSLTQEVIARELGVDVKTLQRLKRLAELPQEFQDMISEGSITPSTGYLVVSKLSEEEQLALLAKLPAAQKFTQAQVQQYIDANKTQMQELVEDNAKYKQEAVEAVRTVKAGTDSAEYMRMQERLKKEEEKARDNYEKWQAEKKKNDDRPPKPDVIKEAVDKATAKTKDQYRRIIEGLQREVDELKESEIPEPTTVEVVPDDYEELKQAKAELDAIKNSSEPDISKQILRIHTDDRTPEQKLNSYEKRLLDGVGGFLSEARGYEVQFDLCKHLPIVTKRLLREEICELQQIFTKLDNAIMEGSEEWKTA